MGKRVTWRWLFCCLFSTPLWAEDSPAIINAEQLGAEQTLPSLSGRLALPTLPAPSGSLTLEHAVIRAVSWHPTIREAIGNLATQNQMVETAKAKYYPQISAGMENGYSHTGSDSGFSPALVLSLSQMLYDFGKVSSQVRAETAGVAQQQANVLVSIDTIALDTATALVQVQMWQQMVKTAREQLEALSGIGKMAQERNTEGASSLSDVVQTEARIEGARSTLMQYQASLDSTRATLMTYLGWRNLHEVSDAFPQKLNSSCDIAEPDDRLVPAVLAAWAQANIAQANLDYANAQMTPTVTLEPQVRHYLNNRYSNNDTLDRTQYTAFVNVAMPIYQGGGLTAQRDAAEFALETAQSAIQRIRLDIRQKLQEARSQALNLVSTLLVQARQEALSERTRELYQQQYLELGSRPLLDVLNAEQEVFLARFAQQQMTGQLRQLQLECLYNTGRMRRMFDLENRTIQSVEIQP